MHATNYENQTLVINWHILEACNYGCEYCFAKYGGDDASIICKDNRKIDLLMQELSQYFQNKLHKNIRFNLAGGEPTLLGDKLLNVLAHAKQLGFSTSIITNASRLNCTEFAANLYRNIDILGISVDSIDSQHNIQIGRVGKNTQYPPLTIDDFVAYTTLARKINPNILIKINSVVNEINKNENLSPLIQAIQPDKWKILQMLPQITNLLSVSDAGFARFVARHKHFEKISVVEDNNAMRNSYIMIDPKGRFYQNNSAKNVQYSQPILTVGCEQAFEQISFCEEKFASRYVNKAKDTAYV